MMNKQQIKILLTKILPKGLLILLIVGGGIGFFVFKQYAEQSKKETGEFFKKGGGEALTFRKGEYDSLMLAGLKIKYPNDYKVQQKQGDEILGEYILLKQFPQSQLIIGYEPKKNAQDILYNSINRVLNDNKNAYEDFIHKEYKITPSSSNIKTKERKGKQIKYIEIEFGNNKVYIYAIETNSHIYRFTSDKNYFLENVISGIELYDSSLTKLENKSTEIKTVNNLKIPLYDWKVLQDVDVKEIKTHHIILENDKNLIAIMSTTHDYITDLKEYSDYYNEKTVRNMKPTGLTLTSKGIRTGKFQGVNSIIESFLAHYQTTGEEFEMEAITIKIDDYFYNINYFVNEKSKQLINNIEISKP